MFFFHPFILNNPVYPHLPHLPFLYKKKRFYCPKVEVLLYLPFEYIYICTSKCYIVLIYSYIIFYAMNIDK